MYRAVYQNPYDTYRSQAIHKMKLKNSKAVIDVKEPNEQPHLMANAKKHEMEEGRPSALFYPGFASFGSGSL